ncbi:MAG: hypothetical protein ABMB14_34710, partial [Myxococcota bacterium]
MLNLLDGPLGARWALALRIVERLLATHNPRLRLEDRPSLDVDWPRTLARGPRTVPEYVCRGSGVGLTEDERHSLLGWCAWVGAEWDQFCVAWKLPSDPFADRLTAIGGEQPREDRGLQRWAHVARRSRWPFLRNVVAETLRAVTEPAALATLPLPTAREDLLELWCLVRLARLVAGDAHEVRW